VFPRKGQVVQALQFSDSIPRYALTKALGKARQNVYWGGLACLQLRDVAPPRLPNGEWVRVRTRYGGICGSDIGTITLHASTSTSVFTSFPFTLGHENVGVISELGGDVAGFAVGERVVVNPLLPCAVRCFAEPCVMCARGQENLCQRFDQGTIAPGLLTGFCRDTGGSWSAEFVAHRSQLLRVPDNLSDEEAVLAEPFAIALHAVLRELPGDDQSVLVIGGGIIGLCAIAALRALGCGARIVASVRHRFQADVAARLGADIVLQPSRADPLERQIIGIFGARSLKPVLGKNVIVGGADIVYECVGSPPAVDDALRFAASGGAIVLVGLAGVPHGVDWTPIWLNELTLTGSFCYATEQIGGEGVSTMALALRLMAEGEVDLGDLVTHRFKLSDYQQALDTVTSKGSSGVIKGVFEF
jgi:threonine dehydrogenase-like Zn-dependent dehydrogenase